MQLVEKVTRIRLVDEVLTAESLRFVRRCLEEADAPVIHLDMGSVKLPTADGLGALVVLNKEFRGRGGELVLFHVSAALDEVLLLTHLVEVLTISPS